MTATEKDSVRPYLNHTTSRHTPLRAHRLSVAQRSIIGQMFIVRLVSTANNFEHHTT